MIMRVLILIKTLIVLSLIVGCVPDQNNSDINKFLNSKAIKEYIEHSSTQSFVLMRMPHSDGLQRKAAYKNAFLLGPNYSNLYTRRRIEEKIEINSKSIYYLDEKTDNKEGVLNPNEDEVVKSDSMFYNGQYVKDHETLFVLKSILINGSYNDSIFINYKPDTLLFPKFSGVVNFKEVNGQNQN